MTEGTGQAAAGVTVEHHLLAEVVTRQLEAMLSVGNYDCLLYTSDAADED